ncbi:MAG: hypothetical protein OXE77_03400 [Flavobacteriaceae bacterium]|nr:hypothetical protein [Flavobacteriaceae bacterium]MCY4266365.1 hypothetical protein [Flavobacteriaceae bacterium]
MSQERWMVEQTFSDLDRLVPLSMEEITRHGGFNANLKKHQGKKKSSHWDQK